MLSREQLDELHPEFINFLATQSIDKAEWDEFKRTKPEVVQQELEVFSDLIWEGVLGRVQYIEHIDTNSMNLFHTGDKLMQVIVVRVNRPIDITTAEGYKWLQNNLMDPSVEILTAKKNYESQPSVDKFKLIQSGGNITQGKLYKYLRQILDLGENEQRNP